MLINQWNNFIVCHRLSGRISANWIFMMEKWSKSVASLATQPCVKYNFLQWHIDINILLIAILVESEKKPNTTLYDCWIHIEKSFLNKKQIIILLPLWKLLNKDIALSSTPQHCIDWLPLFQCFDSHLHVPLFILSARNLE